MLVDPGGPRFMFSRYRPVLVAVLGSLLVTAIVSAAVVPVSGASPSPGPDNPWLDRRVVAVAHAGGEDETPQETLFSYGEADAAGVHVLDLDVRLSSDGVPVVIHDETVDRTTSGTGRVDSFTAAELGALDAAHWFSPACGVCHGLPASEYPYRGVRTGAVAPPPGYAPEDFGVPTLAQVFQRFGDTYYSIEIKEDPDYGQLASKTAALIADHGLTDRTVVSAFADPVIEAFRNVAPEVSTAATLSEVTEFFLTGTVPEDAQMLQVPPAYDLGGTLITVVTPEFVQRAHDAGLAVWVWMNHRSEQNTDFYGELLDMGVDGLNVSRPALLMELLARRGDAWVPPTTTVPEPVPTGVGPILTSPPTAPGVPSTTLSTPAPTPIGPSTTAPEPTPAPTTGEPTTTQDPGRVGTADGHTEPPAVPAQPVRATPAYTG